MANFARGCVKTATGWPHGDCPKMSVITVMRDTNLRFRPTAHETDQLVRSIAEERKEERRPAAASW